MQELTQRVRTAPGPGGGLGSIFGDDSIFTPTVTVIHGVHTLSAAANHTVGEIRRRMRDRLGITDRTPAFVEGRPAADDVRVRPGQKLRFMRKGGEKG